MQLSRLPPPPCCFIMSLSLSAVLVSLLVFVNVSDSASVPITPEEDLESLASSKILLDHASSPSAHFTLATSFPRDIRLNDVVPDNKEKAKEEENETGPSSSSSTVPPSPPNSSSKYGQNLYEMSSPLHVASCRASCLEKFNPENVKVKTTTSASTPSRIEKASTDDIHLLPILRLRRRRDVEPLVNKKSNWNCVLESVECFTCWKSCELLEPGNTKLVQEPVPSASSPEALEKPANEASSTLNSTSSKNSESGKNGKHKQSILPCSHSDFQQCAGGCSVACAFYEGLLSKQDENEDHSRPTKAFPFHPVVATRQESVVRIIPGKITWPVGSHLENSAGDRSVVYVVIQEYPDRKWRQIAQTTRAELEIPKELTSAMKTKLRSVRVFVVGPEGLEAVYSPERPEEQEQLSDNNNNSEKAVTVSKVAGAVGQDKANSGTTPEVIAEMVTGTPSTSRTVFSDVVMEIEGKIEDGVTASPVVNSETTPTTSTTTEEPFKLRLVSLIHQKSLVIAELRWDPIGENPNQEYLITWELTGGGLKGHLVTDSTSVTLSLWPDTHYRIQVEIFEQNLDADGEQPAESSALSLKSLPLTVDTSEASFPIGSPSALLGTDEEDYGEEEDDSEDETEPEEDFDDPSHKSISGYVNLTLVLGISISALVFVLVILTLAAFTWTKMRAITSANNSPTITPSKDMQRSESDKDGCCYGCFAYSSFSPSREPRLLLSQEDLWEDSNFSSPAYHTIELEKGQRENAEHLQYSFGDGRNDYSRASSVAVICGNVTSSSGGDPHGCPYFSYYYDGCNTTPSLIPESANVASLRLAQEGEQDYPSSCSYATCTSAPLDSFMRNYNAQQN